MPNSHITFNVMDIILREDGTARKINVKLLNANLEIPAVMVLSCVYNVLLNGVKLILCCVVVSMELDECIEGITSYRSDIVL